jgi:tellurite resistance protein TehA-like permease
MAVVKVSLTFRQFTNVNTKALFFLLVMWWALVVFWITVNRLWNYDINQQKTAHSSW